MRGLSLVVASGGHSSSRCAGLSLSRPLLLRSTGSRRAGSVIVAHGPSCSAACGIFPDQGSNPCPLHRQADSQPLRHQGSPTVEDFLIAVHEFSIRRVVCAALVKNAYLVLKIHLYWISKYSPHNVVLDPNDITFFFKKTGICEFFNLIIFIEV